VRIPRDVNGQLLKDVASQLGCSIEELIGSLDL
jgi:hypothetical protein